MKYLKLSFITFVLILIFISIGNTQVLISDKTGTPDPSAILELKSTTQGLLIPRMTTAERNLISNEAAGLLVFDLDMNSFFIFGQDKWNDLSTPAGIWETSSSNIFLSNSYSNVGIGTNTPTSKLTVKADGTNKDDVLFEVIGTDGVPVFEVTTNGVKVSVSGDAKAVSRGFAVGQYNTAKATYKDFFTIETDGSTKVHLYGDGTKAISGGFAVGQYNTAKGIAPEEYFNVLPSGTQVNTSNPIAGEKAISRGFAVGQYNTAKAGESNNYLYLKENNAFIGYKAGEFTEAGGGVNNVFIGYMAGNTNVSGSGNVFIGNQAGLNETGGNKLYISNSAADSDNALIYGDFSSNNEKVLLNGTLTFNKGTGDKITMPTTRGTLDQVLTINPDGTTGWKTAQDLITFPVIPEAYIPPIIVVTKEPIFTILDIDKIGTLIVKTPEGIMTTTLPIIEKNDNRIIKVKNARPGIDLQLYTADAKDAIDGINELPLIINSGETYTFQASLEDGRWYIIDYTSEAFVSTAGILKVTGIDYDFEKDLPDGPKVATLILQLAGINAFLPPANLYPNRTIVIKNSEKASENFINAALGDNIDGQSNLQISAPYKSFTLQSDGINTWYVINSY